MGGRGKGEKSPSPASRLNGQGWPENGKCVCGRYTLPLRGGMTRKPRAKVYLARVIPAQGRGDVRFPPFLRRQTLPPPFFLFPYYPILMTRCDSFSAIDIVVASTTQKRLPFCTFLSLTCKAGCPHDVIPPSARRPPITSPPPRLRHELLWVPGKGRQQPPSSQRLWQRLHGPCGRRSHSHATGK